MTIGWQPHTLGLQEAECGSLAAKVSSMEGTIGSLVAHKDDEVDRLRTRVLNTQSEQR